MIRLRKGSKAAQKSMRTASQSSLARTRPRESARRARIRSRRLANEDALDLAQEKRSSSSVAVNRTVDRNAACQLQILRHRFPLEVAVEEREAVRMGRSIRITPSAASRRSSTPRPSSCRLRMQSAASGRPLSPTVIGRPRRGRAQVAPRRRNTLRMQGGAAPRRGARARERRSPTSRTPKRRPRRPGIPYPQARRRLWTCPSASRRKPMTPPGDSIALACRTWRPRSCSVIGAIVRRYVSITRSSETSSFGTARTCPSAPA